MEDAMRMLAWECRLSPMLALAKSRTRLLSADRSGLASLRTIMYVQPTARETQIGARSIHDGPLRAF